MPRLEGKVALISGAAQGMGASHAQAIVQHGGSVVIGDVDDERGKLLADSLGPQARFVHLDVRSNADWDDAVAFAVREFGRLNVLVNNAGVLRHSGIQSCTDDEWDLVISINLTGAFKGIRAASDELTRSSPSSVINISSTAGLKGFAGFAAYGSSKWGLRGLTKNAAIELAPHGIRVNSVHPGNIKTQMIDGLYMDFSHVPQGRAGSAEEISNLVILLASDETSFSTGSEFVADGGETTGLPAIATAD
ncbi:3alpha(or 20beta)-hydroxysteroid dehydrogenase [Paenarthrobacter nicotinovorans]|uniref:SDR family oxidoreductase n=1 Tax=Micrococcaceae TaxID=1268 RepID=UPI0008768A0F|nr:MULTISPECIES: SDR family oxidoreductase [Micrococcaceae]MDR6438728.1 3alpha(or 20beta)-hydroxysteroid dehydrogenase [Paenarthrobacter nicotinovorans]SCZ56458.1 3alpha(or 20beta)-hydroxysteroid dehydrogenase [Arthrobacter sp. UNCCL28]